MTGNTWDTIKTQTKTNELLMGNRKDHIRVRRQRQRKTKSDNTQHLTCNLFNINFTGGSCKGGLFSAGRDGYGHGTPDLFPEVKSFVNCRNTCLQVIDISITLALESGAPRLQPYRISRPCDLLIPAFHTSHSQLISLEINRWFVVKGVFFGQLSRYRHGTPDAGLL